MLVLVILGPVARSALQPAQVVVVQLLQHSNRTFCLDRFIMQHGDNLGLHLRHSAPIQAAVDWAVTFYEPAPMIEAQRNPAALVHELHRPLHPVCLKNELPVPAFCSDNAVQAASEEAHLLHSGHGQFITDKKGTLDELVVKPMPCQPALVLYRYGTTQWGQAHPTWFKCSDGRIERTNQIYPNTYTATNQEELRCVIYKLLPE